MFVIDSFIGWVLDTLTTAAEAEMNDDSVLREQLLEAEMRREIGEISDDEFAEIEADLLARIREIKERREGGSGPLAMTGAQPIETSPDSRFQIEASVSGDFHDPADAPHTTVIETEPETHGVLVGTDQAEQIQVLDMTPGAVEPVSDSGLPLSARPARSRRSRKHASQRKLRRL